MGKGKIPHDMRMQWGSYVIHFNDVLANGYAGFVAQTCLY